MTASKNELWLKIGQSNSVGIDGSGPIDFVGLDAPHPRLFEFSRSFDKNTHYAAPYGEMMLYQCPAQDDQDGIGFGMHFGKHRLNTNPEIEKLMIVNRGFGGTGFSNNRWNSGDDLYNISVHETNVALANYPEFTFKGFIWHQGESDAGQGQAWYQNALSTMVSNMRTDIKGASDASIFVCGTMLEAWIANDETSRRPIDLAHRNISNYIANSTFTDFSDITDNNDSIHFGTEGLREMGKRYSETVNTMFENIITSPYLTHKINFDRDMSKDVIGNNGLIYGKLKIVEDFERGYVLDTNDAGYNTSIFVNPNGYTKSCWVKVLSNPNSYGNLMSGRTPSGPASSWNVWGWEGFSHGLPARVNIGLKHHANINEWIHVTLTFNGSEFRFYKNGILEHSGSQNARSLPDIQPLSLGCFNGVGNHTLNCLMDEITVLPYSINDTEAMQLYKE